MTGIKIRDWRDTLFGNVINFVREGTYLSWIIGNNKIVLLLILRDVIFR